MRQAGRDEIKACLRDFPQTLHVEKMMKEDDDGENDGVEEKEDDDVEEDDVENGDDTKSSDPKTYRTTLCAGLNCSKCCTCHAKMLRLPHKTSQRGAKGCTCHAKRAGWAPNATPGTQSDDDGVREKEDDDVEEDDVENDDVDKEP